ncbi:unnamed protein product [Arctogadus glacialis]
MLSVKLMNGRPGQTVVVFSIEQEEVMQCLALKGEARVARVLILAPDEPRPLSDDSWETPGAELHAIYLPRHLWGNHAK